MKSDTSNIILRLHTDIDKYICELDERTKEGLKKIKADNGEGNRELKNLIVVFISLQELQKTLDVLTSIESITMKQKVKRAEELINHHLIVNKKKEKRSLASLKINETFSNKNNRNETSDNM